MDMNKLLSEAMKLQENLTSSQERLEKEVFEASMGGGAVKVSVKGSMEIEKIQIADELMEKENKEDLEELLLACMNQALSKVKEEKVKNMKSMTGGMSIPGVF